MGILILSEKMWMRDGHGGDIGNRHNPVVGRRLRAMVQVSLRWSWITSGLDRRRMDGRN